MSQTILIETNIQHQKILADMLSTFVGTDVIHLKSAEDAIEFLKILPEVSLIVTLAQVDDENSAEKIHRYLREEKLSIPMIIMGFAPYLPSHNIVCLPEPVNWEVLVKKAADFLKVPLKFGQTSDDFFPLDLFYFYDIQSVPCDVYVRIKESADEYKFIKLIHSQNAFDKEMIDKYEGQGLNTVYIHKDSLRQFTTYVSNRLIQKLEREDLNLEERILTTANAHSVVRDIVQQWNEDHSWVELSSISIDSLAQTVKSSPQTSVLNKFLLNNRVSYAYQHCHLLTLMCHYVLSRQSWYKKEHLEVLSFVAFFSDVTLRSVEQMQISCLSDLHDSGLSDEGKAQVLTHPQDAVSVLDAHPEASDYIKLILLQSNGTSDGVGFEENPGEDLHPLSKIFIISDAFVKVLMNPDLPSSKKEILPILTARYTNPSYQKVIHALAQKYQ